MSESAGTQALASFDRLAEEGTVSVITEIDEGSVDDVILGNTDDHDVDLNVMGTHGREGVARQVVGSVAERVIRGGTSGNDYHCGTRAITPEQASAYSTAVRTSTSVIANRSAASCSPPQASSVPWTR